MLDSPVFWTRESNASWRVSGRDRLFRLVSHQIALRRSILRIDGIPGRQGVSGVDLSVSPAIVGEPL